MIFEYRINEQYLPIIERARKVLPVNVARLAEKLEIGVEYGDMEKAGYIEYRDGAATIHARAADPLARQRFTIAHEIAHYLIHREELEQKGSLDRDENPLLVYTSKLEAEANALAADILMPRDEIAALLEYSDITTVVALADYLQVSEQAVEIKLKIPPRS